MTVGVVTSSRDDKKIRRDGRQERVSQRSIGIAVQHGSMMWPSQTARSEQAFRGEQSTPGGSYRISTNQHTKLTDPNGSYGAGDVAPSGRTSNVRSGNLRLCRSEEVKLNCTH
jgi:hypothetical protein